MKQTQMYVCTLEDIYSGRCSHIAVQVVSDGYGLDITVVYIHSQQYKEKDEKALRSQLTQRNE